MLIRLLTIIGLLGALAACDSQNPTSPTLSTTSASPTAAEGNGSSTISGRIYAQGDNSDHTIADASIDVVSDAGAVSVHSTTQGYYTLIVPRGALTITASKDGYAPKTWDLDVRTDLVLNFSLDSE